MPPIEGPQHPTPKDYPAFLKFLSRCYGFSDPRWFEDDAAFFFGRRPGQLKTKWAFKEGARFASHIGLFPYTALVEGRNLKVAGIGAVATDPDFRGRGLMKRLMGHVQEQMKRDGYALSLLWGERSLYAPYGYERCLFQDQFSFRKKQLDYFAVPGKVRPAVARDLPAIQKLQGLHPFRAQRNLAGTASSFRRFERPGEKPVWVLEEKGRVVAYSVFWRPASFWKKSPGPLDVAEWGGSAEDVACLWASVLHQDQDTVLTATIYPGCGLFDWAQENGFNRIRTSQSCMIQVLDLLKVLKAFEPQLQQRYEVLGVRMDRTLYFRTENGRVAGLECGRRLKVVGSGGRGRAIPLSSQETTRLLFGAGRPSREVKALGGEGWLDGLFPLDWYWWRTDWF